TVEGLRGAIQDTLDLLASPAGLLVKPLLARDPTGEMVQIIDQVGEGQAPRTEQGVWSCQRGKRALLIAQTAAARAVTDAQLQAIDPIRTAFAASGVSLPPAA